jgi:ComF family protein
MFYKAVNTCLNFLYPPACVSCKEITLEDSLLCHSCWQKFKFISPPFCNACGFPFAFEIENNALCGKCIKSPPRYNQARYLFKYDESSKKLIHALKYNDQTYLARIFAKLLFNSYKQDILKYDVIAPVPMHWLKRMFRMYNQAMLLAQEISSISGLPVINDNLQKVRWTKAQSSLDKNARLSNLQGSFKVKNPDFFKGKKVILVDDVLTTGATVKECAKLLKKSGASQIMVLTIAAT